MKIRIDLKIIAVIIIFLFTGQLRTYCLIMFFCFWHELGHIITAKLFNMKIEKIEVLPCGFSSSFIIEKKDMENLKEMLVAMAGPIVSFILVLISQYIYIDEVNVAIITKQEIIYSNILILIFNLLPLYPLDGGRILKSILSIKFGEKDTEVIVNKVSYTTIIFLTLVSSIAVYYFKNVAIFLSCIFLWNIILGDKFKQNVKLNSI